MAKSGIVGARSRIPLRSMRATDVPRLAALARDTRYRRFPASPSLRQVEIADAVVGGRAEPHAALIVEEEVAHGILRARHRILDHLAGRRIEPPDHVHVFRRVPD